MPTSKLYEYGYVFKRRGEIEVKGKGVMTTFFLVGSGARSCRQPADGFSSLPDEACDKAVPRTWQSPRPSATPTTMKSVHFLYGTTTNRDSSDESGEDGVDFPSSPQHPHDRRRAGRDIQPSCLII